MKKSPFFFDPTLPLRHALTGGAVPSPNLSSFSARVARMKSRVFWSGYRLIEIGGNSFAFVHSQNEMVRYPDRGGYSIDDAVAFIRARENEPIF